MRATAAPMTHTQFLSTRRFGVLDGLRAIAVLLVFTAHPRGEIWPVFHGATGVTLFFVLSGFLITTLLLREEDRHGRVDFTSFYIRRTFRIYPMFLGIFAVYCVLILVLGMQPERRASFVENIPYTLLLFPEHMTFFNTWDFYPPYNGAWSIGIEEKFYLVWPLLGFAVLAKWKSARLPVLSVLAAASLGTSFVDRLMFLAPYQHLAFGAVAAILLHRQDTYPAVARLGRPRVLACIVVVGLVLQFGTGEVLPYGTLYGLHGLVLALVVTGLVTTQSRRTSWLSSRPLAFLAAISYVFYLVHNFFLNGVEAVVPATWGAPGGLLSAGIAFVLSVAASWVIHERFEEPLRRYGVRLALRRDAPRQVRTPGTAPLERVAP